jgi:hypothetical protein
LSSELKKNKKTKKWLTYLIKILKILAIPFLIIVSIYVGLWIGYVKLGNQPASDIFILDTWKHVFNYILN